MEKQYVCLNQKTHSINDYLICSIRNRDIMAIREWRNAQMDVLRQKTPISEENQIAYFNTHIWPSFSQRQPKQILVSYLYKDICIGYGGLVHISWEDKRAELSFLLNPERHNHIQYDKDFTAFIGLIKEMAFDNLGFHRIFTETYDIRERHIAILEKNGFVKEGTLKDHVIIHNKYIDSFIHGCLNK